MRHVICLVTDRQRLSPDASSQEGLDRLVDLVQAAAHAGTWATMAAGSIALVVGMFLGLTISNNSHDRA